MKVVYPENNVPTGTSPDMPNIGGLNIIIANYDDFVVPLHSHDFDELVIVLGGTAEHEVNGETHTMTAGDVFVIKGNDKHSLSQTQNFLFCNLAYMSQKLDISGSDLRKLSGYHALFVLEPIYRKSNGYNSFLHLSGLELPFITELVTSMEKEYNSSLPASESMINAYFLQLVIFLSRKHSIMEAGVPSTIFSLASAISYIENHYTEDLNLRQLASIANVSVNHFLRLFKKTYNISPMGYLKRLRISKACEKLKNTYLSISEISSAVGIPDSNYFSRLFKDRTGKSPREYRG